MVSRINKRINLPANFYLTVGAAFLLQFFFAGVYAQTSDTIKIYFDLNKTSLSQDEAVKINTSISKNASLPGTSYMVFGYADNLGGESHNNTLSEQRANNVSGYLVSLGVQKDVISLIEGKGEIKKGKAPKGGYPEDRRVDIVVLKTAAAAEEKPKVKEPEKPVFVKYPIGKALTGQVFVLNNVYFYANRHTVRPESLPELDELYDELVSHPEVDIKIEGHVCCIHPNADPGSVSFKNTKYDAMDMDVPGYISEDDFAKDSIHYNPDALSVNRAKFIYHYLIHKGIAKDRLSYRGFGNLRPVVKDEQTKEDEQLNRRIEVRIVGE